LGWAFPNKNFGFCKYVMALDCVNIWIFAMHRSMLRWLLDISVISLGPMSHDFNDHLLLPLHDS
jgi:hypothetical protein